MPKFPVDAPKAKVIKAFNFRLVREGNHIAMSRQNADGTNTPLTVPTTARLKDPRCGQYFPNRGFHGMIS